MDGSRPLIFSCAPAGWRRWTIRAYGIAFVVMALFVGCSDDTTNPPILQVVPAEIELAPPDSGGTFEVRNAGSGTLDWTLHTDAAWLVLDVAQGSTTDSDEVGFSIDHDSLLQRPSVAKVEVSSNGGDMDVRIRVRGGLLVSADLLDFGESDSTRQLYISNAGADSVQWAGETGQPWITIAPSCGSITAGFDTVSVTVDRLGLDIGDHTGAVWIDAGAEGKDTILVTMAVPSIATVSGHVYFAATEIPVSEVAVSIGAIADTTGQDGVYNLPGVPAGEQMLLALREGFDDYEEMVEIPGWRLVRDLEMTSDLHTRNVIGQVTNSLGHPIHRADVAALNPDSSVSGLTTKTEEDGTYLLEGVPEGSGRIRYAHAVYDDLALDVEIDGGDLHQDAQLAAALIPAPGGLALDRFGCSTVRICWSARYEETVAGYHVERAVHGTGAFNGVSGLIDPAVLCFENTGLELGTYDYQLRTENIDQQIGDPDAQIPIELFPWTLLNDGSSSEPHVRWGHGAIYDPNSGNPRMVIFGGTGCVSGQCGVPFNDVWALSLSSYTWAELDEGTGPEERNELPAIYDETRHRMVLFGGGHEHQFDYDDTWAFDLSSCAWTRIGGGGTSPPARHGHSAVYDRLGERMIIYGGAGAETLNDVWALDLSAGVWECLREGVPGELDPQPRGRYFHTAVYDPSGHRMVVHGGTYRSGEYYKDTWAFDLATDIWICLPDGPARRRRHTAVYDQAAARMLVFGGRGMVGAGLHVEVQAFYLGEERWEELDGGPEETIAPAREYHSAIQQLGSGGMVVFGGRLSQALGSDTWAFCRSW